MMIGNVACASIFAFVIIAATCDIAAARSAYDGSWSLSIVTERGSCDPTYNFLVNIANGIVSHPNLAKLKGRVASGGAVRVSVSAGGKSASGSGRLSQSAGRGRWTGYSGSNRCSGHWTAQRS
jgi:hypothetical protein